MGYTNHWYFETITPSQWAQLAERTRHIVSEAAEKGIVLTHEFDTETAPYIGKDFIRFNGLGYDGHETFYFERESSGFNFCKTNRKPYDAAVVAVLLAAERIVPSFAWKSDGRFGGDEHLNGVDLLIKATESQLLNHGV